MSSRKMIVLKSCDGESFEVEEAVALESTTIKHVIEDVIKDDWANNGIPLPNVTGKILAKVVEYCKKHVEVSTTQDSNNSSTNSNGAVTNGGEEDLKSWDADFVKVDLATLFDLIQAADYLEIKGLLDLTKQTVDMFTGKTLVEIQKLGGKAISVFLLLKKMLSPKMITLKSCDGKSIEVEEAVALESTTIKHMLEDSCAYNSIPLPNVTGNILAKVVEYCENHVVFSMTQDSNNSNGAATNGGEEDLKSWDADFVKVDQDTLFDLILAANYLNIKGLLDLTCQTVADMFKGKSPREIQKTFNIKIDFTPEEVEEVRRENQWAFE